MVNKVLKTGLVLTAAAIVALAATPSVAGPPNASAICTYFVDVPDVGTLIAVSTDGTFTTSATDCTAFIAECEAALLKVELKPKDVSLPTFVTTTGDKILVEVKCKS